MMNIELYCDGNTIENAIWADVEAVLPKLQAKYQSQNKILFGTGETMLDPHDITLGSKPNSFRYVRRYPDGTIYAQEQQIRGNKLEFRSLWKQELGFPMLMVFSAISSQENED